MYVYNDQDVSNMIANITDDLIPGVVCLLEGIWVDLDEQGLDRAGSAYIFTSTAGIQSGRAPIMHAIAVEVAANMDAANLTEVAG